jgi:hypothetical protein
MRLLQCVTLLGAPLFAQTAEPLTLQELMRLPVKPRLQPRVMIFPQIRRETLASPVEPSRPCAIPLRNVLRSAKTVAIPKVPASPNAMPMREIDPPAPSCDDQK